MCEDVKRGRDFHEQEMASSSRKPDFENPRKALFRSPTAVEGNQHDQPGIKII